MHRAVLFLLFSLIGIQAINCPFGYTDDDNGNCQSAKLGPSNQINAYTTCAKSNAYLINVINAFSNRDIVSQAGAFDKIWTGLSCSASNTTSCVWDNGSNVTLSTYTNFYPGHPNADVGSCVYMATSTGQWFSGSCSQVQAVYLCRATPGINVPICPGYSYYYRGRCYFSVYGLGYSDAASQCSDNCGQFASIHTLGENSFVRDIVQSNLTTATYGIIGLSYNTDNSLIWADYTPVDFQNYGFNNQVLGNCFLISATADVVQKGQWISADCTYNAVGVCEKALTCDVPTVVPIQCASGAQFLSGSGTLYSPGYPRDSVTNLCEWIITQQSGFITTITFPEISLDRNSSIKLYSSIMDTVPFATITNIEESQNMTYYSGTNLLKVIFETYDNTYFKNLWRAEYGSLATMGTNCGGTYRAKGRIAGLSNIQSCTYSIKIGAKKTCLKFFDFNVQDTDVINIYDGSIDAQNQIGMVTAIINYGIKSLALCTSNSNTITIVTSGTSKLSYNMFSIDVTDSYQELSPTMVDRAQFPNYVYPDRMYSRLINRDTQIHSDYYDSSSHLKVLFSFSSINFPNTNSSAFILDGTQCSPVALAYGINGPSWTRTLSFQSTTNYITIVTQFNQVLYSTDLIGWSGNVSDTNIPMDTDTTLTKDC